MTINKLAIVTGANKGIGRAIVKNLALEHTKKIRPNTTPLLTIFLTSRDEQKGIEATNEVINELKSRNAHYDSGGAVKVKFHQLDVTDENSVQQLKNNLQREYKAIDILINNAAVGDEFHQEPFTSTLAEKTLRTNYWSLKKITQVLLPLIRDPGGRIVNLASGLGHLGYIPSKSLQDQFNAKDLTFKTLDELMKKFVNDANTNNLRKEGWPTSGTIAYKVSKVGVIAYSKILAQNLSQKGKKIIVKACCPGWVRTDMGGQSAELSPDQGAETPVYLAIGDDERFLENNLFLWKSKQPIDW
ncbi:hypothetical protein G9A89_023004 [Geosiphon pyriformis]|nr:hypothetical protein G9A89_023004 [Geosiphon pyriformis]